MAGRQIFNPDGFCNVTEDGKTVGFSFAFKAQYYRGFTLSILRDIAVTVDDENFNREDIRLTVNGETFTLEECRTVIDPERFEQTVTAYNGYCETGDTEFFKDKRFLLPIWKAPFYAARIRPSGYGTVGGIRINENCEACGPDFYPIPGLYAAGADACNIYDDSYMFLLPGNSMGFAINSGRIAGMSAADYVSGKGLSKEE